jgi:DNA-binding transcriptional LysR family regulator
MHRLETRELAYFMAVAEEMHFGRAAERLDMAQPPLSRAIRQLERRLGVALLERSNRNVTRTAAGEVLLIEARKALDAVAAATRRTQRAGQPRPRLVLTMSPGCDGGMLQDILLAYESDPDAIPVEIIFGVGERVAMLRDGRADLSLLYSPASDLSGLDTQELLVEQPLAILPPRHRLARRRAIRLADLQGEPIARWPGTPADRWPGPPAGPATGPEVRDSGELMQLVALGRAVAVEPKSVLGPVRSDVACIPVLDAPVSTVLIAWPQQARSPAVAAFVDVATTVAAHHQAAAPATSNRQASH